MITLLIYLIVLIILVALALYVIQNFVTDPMLNKVLRVVVVVIACLAAVSMLLGIGGAGVDWPRLR